MLKTRWETIRDDVAGMLADGVPLEDITGKLEKLKNEYQKPLTNEEWFCRLNTVEKAKWLADNFGYVAYKASGGKPETVQEQFIEYWQEWLKQPHREVGK